LGFDIQILEIAEAEFQEIVDIVVSAGDKKKTKSIVYRELRERRALERKLHIYHQFVVSPRENSIFACSIPGWFLIIIIHFKK